MRSEEQLASTKERDMSEIEQMIKDLGADKFPRVSEDSIKEKISLELFSRFDNAGLTICILQMKNGFTFIGHSACASPENYNKEIGDKIARDNAFRQIWSHEGYLLKEQLYQQHVAAGAMCPTPSPNDDLTDADLQASLGDRPHP